MTRQQLLSYARVGAELELQKLNAERDAILKAFPDFNTVPAKVKITKVVATKPKTGRVISKALRAKMTAGIRRYWRAKRAAQKVQH